MKKAPIPKDERPAVFRPLETALLGAARFPEMLADSLPDSQPATQIFPYEYGLLGAVRF